MKGYEVPEIVEKIDVMESIYAASGWVPPEDPDEPEDVPDEPSDFTFTNVEWRGHNGGSHSEGHIDVHYCGPANHAHGVRIKCATNFDFEPGMFDGCGSCNITVDGTRNFTVTRTNGGCLNPNENLGINFKIVGYVPEYVKENGTQGAVGDSNHPNATKYCFKIIGSETV